MTYLDEVNNTVDGNKEIQSSNILGVYDKANNSFIRIEVNEEKNIEIVQGKKSIFDVCKKLREYEDLNEVDEDKRLTNVFALDKSIIVKAKGVSDKQIFDELDKYNSEVTLKENNLDKYKKLYEYELSYKIPSSETLTQWFGDYSMYEPKMGVTEEQINSRLAYFDKISELITNIIKNDKLIEKFMVIINTKGIEEAYIDDESHNGVAEGVVQFLSRQEQIEKIMSTLVTFKDPVIVSSKEELEKLQAEFIETHGKKLVHRSEEKEVIRDKKAELLKLMNEQKTRGYIRISDEDYIEIKNQIEEMGITYIAKESGNKLGMNIVVPVNEMHELKDLLLKSEIKILQEVEGNTDWFKFKKAEDINTHDISSETLKSFQNLNSDKFKYIAFENEGKYSIYTEPGCTVEIKDEKIKYKEDGKNHEKKTLKEVAKKKDEYKKSKEEVTTKVNEKNNSRGER